MIKDFKSFLNENFDEDLGRVMMPKKTISKEEIDNMPEDQLNRILLAYNDGQGDHGSYTFKKIHNSLVEEGTSNSDAIDQLYDQNNGFLTGNNSDWYYFDNQYYEIEWSW